MEKVRKINIDMTDWRKVVEQSAVYILAIPSKDSKEYSLAVEKFKYALQLDKLMLITIAKDRDLPAIFRVQSKKISVFKFVKDKVNPTKLMNAITKLVEDNNEQ